MPLPTFEVERVDVNFEGKRTWVKATCPRKECKGTFLITLSWRRNNKYKSCPCPHCFKVSAIPKYRGG